ncbi:alkaline phosphatase [Anaeropeptidivorans aminofermentans]|uniref:alkaline phosphatase n=1 Tax=Anaeropeptidivorans aminofermentans TaxID=2934315 RepID=UPI00202573D0|nr:alkaline phosphatase [Anaeropeptidivorans aminofermentans]
MKSFIKKAGAAAAVIALTATTLVSASLSFPAEAIAAKEQVYSGKAPKYIFMFIGDGMSYPQVTSAMDYLGVMSGTGKVESKDLTFTAFPVVGSAQTFDSSSFAPDSASTATSLATGKKTLSGVINMDETKTVKYETIAEKLKNQLGYKVGVVSSVNINHATPAAYYAHQASRGNYYEIGLELTESKFDYFAGGDFLSRTGKNKDLKDIYEVAKEKGYTVINTAEEFKSFNDKSKKLIAITPTPADADSMSYAIDRKAGEISLADYTKKGIELLDNSKGFFLMVESGKIDWTCHANDAATSVKETIDFDESIEAAVDFYNKHPEETLILVTGDHETGGMTIGYSGTGYSTYLDLLARQKISFKEYDKKIAEFRENKASFENVMEDIRINFGLTLNTSPESANTKKELILTDYEVERLKTAYNQSMLDVSEREVNPYDSLYSEYEPLSVTITHILNNKAGIGWTSWWHTGLPVPVYAMGAGQNLFSGFYDNTDVFVNLKALTKVN